MFACMEMGGVIETEGLNFDNRILKKLNEGVYTAEQHNIGMMSRSLDY